MSRPVILSIGGDARYIYVNSEMCRLGDVYACGAVSYYGNTVPVGDVRSFDKNADMLILPMLNAGGTQIDCSKGKISCEEIAPHLSRNSLVVGGKLNREVIEFFSSLGHDVADYFDREELAVRNCIPTAEGALSIALNELAVTVFSSKVLIVGYGRVAKACAKTFKALGAEVRICARSIAQLACAENDGMKTSPLSEISDVIGEADIVINTVPALVVGREAIGRTSQNVLIIDLASSPGGVDHSFAKECGRKSVLALALPGKTAPVTAGKIIAETIGNIYHERRKTNVFQRH